MTENEKNKNSSKVNFTIAICRFRGIVSLYLETPTVLFQKFALYELGLDEILCGNLGENG